MKTRIIPLLILLPLLGGAISSRGDETFTGHFTGDGLDFKAQGDQGNYTGTIAQGTNTFDFTATDKGKGKGLSGSFTTPDGPIDFQATIKAEKLTLTIVGTRFKLTRYIPLVKPKTDDGTATIIGIIKSQGTQIFGGTIIGMGTNGLRPKDAFKKAGEGALVKAGQEVAGAAPVQSTNSAPAQPGSP
jgi:hypothetical protein